jgi:hypothetical protein
MIEQANVNPVVAGPTANRLVPGYLFTPFGWAGQKLAAMTGPPEAGLLAQLFELDRKRMHLVALALAHLDCELTPELASFFLRASVREVLRRVLGHSPLGIRRVLSLLPFAVLSQQSYRYLVQLLDDPETRKLPQYLFDTELTDAMIRVLLEVPAPLRAVALAVRGSVERLETLPDGLRLLVSRGAAPTLDALVGDLATRSQPGQFIGRIRQHIASLPLPETLPPAQIGMARRIDSTEELCTLGKRFRNCIGDLIDGVDAGEFAIYLWDDPTAQAVCQVSRHGRLGWALSEAVGPRNVDLAHDPLQAIRSAFAQAGIPDYSCIHAIEWLVGPDGYQPCTRRRWQCEREERERELQDGAWDQETQRGAEEEIPVPPGASL